MSTLHSDPINRTLITEYFEALFPGIKATVGPRIGGQSTTILIWKFEITVSFTTSATSHVDEAGTASVSLSYKPDDKRVNVSRIPVLKHNTSCAGELLKALEECRQYLSGIVATIELALTVPTPDPVNRLGLFDSD